MEAITQRKAEVAAEYITCTKISSIFIQHKHIWTTGKLRRNGIDDVFLKNKIAGNVRALSQKEWCHVLCGLMIDEQHLKKGKKSTSYLTWPTTC